MDFPTLGTIAVATPLEQLSEAQVKELQSALEGLGYGLDADGLLGPLTKSVWARFKSDNALNDPDLIGPDSVGLLKRRLAGESGSEVPHAAVLLVKSFEGYSATAYDDKTGVWTIGYGTTEYPDGSSVKRGQTVTETQALTYLANDMDSTAKTLAATIPYWSTMNPNQRSALISFGYNLGAGFYDATGFNTISGTLRTHRWSDVPSVFPMYSDPGDPTVHAGLLRRRIAEGDLWRGQGPFASQAVM